MNNTRNYRRGDIYLSKTGPRIGNRSSTRAVLLLQNDADEFYSTSVFAVPIAMKPSPFPAPSDDVRVYLTSMSLVQYSRAGAVDKRTLTDYAARWTMNSLKLSASSCRSIAGCSSLKR